MKNSIYRIANRLLALTLILAILANGALAVYQTHITATLTFGLQPKQFAEAVSTKELRQFAALPTPPAPVPDHKPQVQ